MATTQVLRDATATRTAVLELFEWAESISFAYAWMSADDQRGSPWRLLPFEKIERCVVGLQFGGTDPEVLDELAGRVPERVRVMYETKGTFHPKVLIGTRRGQARAIVGSSNFTRAAFSANFELNLLLEGPEDVTPLHDLTDVVRGYFESGKARRLDSDVLEAYRKMVAQGRPQPPRLVPLSRGSGRRRRALTVESLDVEWDAYRDLLLDQDQREFVSTDGGIRLLPTSEDDNAYLTELRWAREAFSAFGSLANMDIPERETVAGLGDSLGWFGRMTGAGYYKQLIKSDVGGLSEALDHIPSEGDFDDDEFSRASMDALRLRGVGLGCWTRLLCVKRPDLFLSVNKASVDGIRRVFGSAPTTLPPYLVLTRRIHEFPWARPGSEPPGDATTEEMELWRGRVALLDALFYEPTGATGPG